MLENGSHSATPRVAHSTSSYPEPEGAAANHGCDQPRPIGFIFVPRAWVSTKRICRLSPHPARSGRPSVSIKSPIDLRAPLLANYVRRPARRCLTRQGGGGGGGEGGGGGGGGELPWGPYALENGLSGIGTRQGLTENPQPWSSLVTLPAFGGVFTHCTA